MIWFRFYNEFASDPKIQSMSEAMQRRLVMLFCLRSCDVLVTLHETDIAFALRISDEELADTKKVFMRKGFIDSEWNLTNWDKRQCASDSSTERTRMYRERKKNVTVTSQERQCDGREENREDKIRVDNKKIESIGSAVSVSAKPKRASTKISDEEWMTSLKSNTAYDGIDIEREAGKCLAWCQTKGYVMTRPRFVNWLNKADRPLKGNFQNHPKSFDQVRKEQNIQAAIDFAGGNQ